MDIFLGTLFCVVCVLLILIVLLQKGRGGGLGAAFGGAGSSAFGTRTGDVFTWVTIVLTGLFLVLAISAVKVFREAPKPAATVNFDPAEGEIAKPTTVHLATPTKNAVIRYTIDGSEPTEQSPKYVKEDGIVVDPGMTIKARAFKPAMLPSEIRQAYYGAPGSTTAPATASAPATQRAEQ